MKKCHECNAKIPPFSKSGLCTEHQPKKGSRIQKPEKLSARAMIKAARAPGVPCSIEKCKNPCYATEMNIKPLCRVHHISKNWQIAKPRRVIAAPRANSVAEFEAMVRKIEGKR